MKKNGALVLPAEGLNRSQRDFSPQLASDEKKTKGLFPGYSGNSPFFRSPEGFCPEFQGK